MHVAFGSTPKLYHLKIRPWNSLFTCVEKEGLDRVPPELFISAAKKHYSTCPNSKKVGPSAAELARCLAS